MKIIDLKPQKDFLDRISNAGSIQALSELIWNGLDAGSETIEVELERNGMDGLETVRVIDQGSGIYYPHVDSLFGALGASWKKEKRRENGRAIHGKKGQGRLKAFALGNEVSWQSTYGEDRSKRFTFTIEGRDGKLSASEPKPEVNDKGQGTQVTVSDITKSHGALLNENAHEELAKTFAPYLSQYPNVCIYYDGVKVDPTIHQERTKEISLDPIYLSDGCKVEVAISIIEWKIDAEREIHLCDENGVSLMDTKAQSKIRAPGFNFTAYLKSDYFAQMDEENGLDFFEMHSNLNEVYDLSLKAINKYFRRRKAEQNRGAVERWKAEKVYPFEEKSDIGPVEEAERQVFDIIAVNVEAYLPHYAESDLKSKQFTFRLLAQALKQNPESLREVIFGVLNLKKKSRKI